ncbi:glutaredoxin-1 [Lobosporangium transversale]|uniref:Glutaredoxin-1 n=1 Tax=Lobosporangium transversale TaxID=64571 RepID=A0A1Y2G7J9_9FUNG|nr:glutaredoxin-1 [Lobosporangium transversale]ORZ00027.1 glutaredoxin-1 [Lobosporangium transversale]|eukprot:XP_021876068.1 glutaredoxin-1 [Lobosporangium transversale]
MESTLKAEIDNIINSHDVVMFSKSYCPYCAKAKALLAQHGVKVFIMELDDVENGAAIQAYLKELTGQRTVPNIFINKEHIGGCDDLFKLEKSGQLKALLAKF